MGTYGIDITVGKRVSLTPALDSSLEEINK